MTTLLEIPLRDAQPAVIEGFQKKYPQAVLRIEADNSLHTGGMDEEQFWAIIGLLDWKQPDRPAIVQPALEALSRCSKADIHTFHDLLNEKLYALDGQRFAVHLGSNRYSDDEDNSFSVDDFLYARCGVVSQGQTFYEAVLNNPAKMPKEFTFEQLLYLPERAWRLKTGRDDYDYAPETWSETFSNPDGWPGMMTMKERLLNL